MNQKLVDREELTHLKNEPVNSNNNDFATDLVIDPREMRDLGALLEKAEENGYEILQIILGTNEKIENLGVLGDYVVTYNLLLNINIDRTSKFHGLEFSPSLINNLRMLGHSGSYSLAQSFDPNIVFSLRKKLAS